MAGPTPPERFSLSRWSRRKLEVVREKAGPAPAVDASPPEAAATTGPAEGVSVAPEATPAPASVPAAGADLPPVESLNLESDFTGFLKPEVDESTRRAALRKLFSDPRFNVMDGLDVYIDDYTKPSPIPEDVLGKLAHARYLFDPPKTRVNAAGFVEDVPEDEAVASRPAEVAPAGASATTAPDATGADGGDLPASGAGGRASADDASAAPPADPSASPARDEGQASASTAGADLAPAQAWVPPAQAPAPPGEPVAVPTVQTSR